MLKVKYIPVILVTGMLIGLLVLGAQYLFKSINIVDSMPLLPGAQGRVSFFAKSEVESLELAPAKINVYSTDVYMFSNDKFSQPGNANYTVPVERQTRRTDIATFALEEIMRGPTAEETEQGLRSTFGDEYFITLSGKSQCGIRNFTITLDPDNYFARVNFCKDINFTQDWSMMLLQDQIRKTLIQFEKIQKVQILNKDGNCLDGTKITTPEDCVH
jgi:hypothetical protein